MKTEFLVRSKEHWEHGCKDVSEVSPIHFSLELVNYTVKLIGNLQQHFK